jgi:hypothetical protein
MSDKEKGQYYIDGEWAVVNGVRILAEELVSLNDRAAAMHLSGADLEELKSQGITKGGVTRKMMRITTDDEATALANMAFVNLFAWIRPHLQQFVKGLAEVDERMRKKKKPNE